LWGDICGGYAEVKPPRGDLNGLPRILAARRSSNLDDIERIFKIAEKLVRRLPPPWERSKQRDIGEAFFGGIPLMATAHNLRTLARVRAMKEIGVFIVLWIYSTNSSKAKDF